MKLSTTSDTKHLTQALWGPLLLGLAGAATAQTSTSASSSQDELEEIVVTGTLLESSGFSTPTPVTVVGQDLIKARAPSDAGEILKEIPSLKVSNGPGSTGGGQRTAVGQVSVDFYGLGSFRTLTLIDGQRQAGSTASSNVDISTIPTLMIERVETITGGASAAYGADAMGGVANFILRNKIDGLTFNTSFGTTAESDKQVKTLNVGFGTNLGSRANLLVGIDLSRDDGIDSMYERDWGRKEPGRFSTGTGATRGAQPASRWVNSFEQKNNTPGGIITGCSPPTPTGFTTANCPGLVGLAFDASGASSPFVYGTTTPNTSATASGVMYGNNSNYGNNPNGQQALFADYQRWTGLAKIYVDLTDDTKLKLSMGYSGMSASERVDVIQNFTTVTTANPFLPTNIRDAMTAAGKTSIVVGRSNTDLGYDYTGQLNRLVTGGAQLTGKIAGSWSYDTYYKFSEATSDGWQDGFRTADINAAFSNCTVTTGASPGCVGYNIFGVGQASQAAQDYLHQYQQGFYIINKMSVVQALVRGAPFATWAGDVNVAVGAHYRKENMSRALTRDSSNPRFSTTPGVYTGFTSGFSFGNYSAFSAKRDVKEYFGEANVPLVKDVPFVQALNLNLGHRYLDYSDNGPWNAWKAGLSWDINDQVRLRGTRSRDIRSPHLFQQYGTGSNTPINVTDPRNNTIVSVSSTNPSPNSGLHPETAGTTTVGIILQPHWVNGLRMSVDYFSIKIKDVITLTTSQNIVDGCLKSGNADLCSFITFAGPGQTGALVATKNPNFNFNRLDVAGYNAEVDYSIPGQFLAGSWNVRALATYMDEYTTFNSFTNAVLNDIGTPTAGQPRLQTNFLLTYKHGPFSTTAAVRYMNGLKFASDLVGPDNPLYNSTVTTGCPGGGASCPWYQTATNSISQNKFPSATYLNWSAQYDIGGTPLKELQLYAKVDNVLDKDPPDYAYVAFGGLMYDFIGRNYKVGVRASF